MKKFTSVDDLFEDITKNSSPWHRFILKHEWLRWLIYNAEDVPFDFYRKCKRGWQRAYWGISDEDVWGLDHYLSRVILRGLKKLKTTKHGTPILDGFDGESEFEEMEKQWNLILDSIIWTFEATRKIQDMEWLMLPENGFTNEQTIRLSKDFRIMTKDEMEKYNKGWDLFKRYYYSLWN